MAKGTDSDGSVLLSKVRTGLKREFVFALKAQAEMSGSLGRTRASGAFENQPSKRMKKADKKVLKNGGGEDLNVKDLVEDMSEEDAKSDVLDLVSDDEPKSNMGESVLSERVEEDELKNGVVEMAVDEEVRTIDSREEDLKRSDIEKPLVDEEMPVLIETGGEQVECEVVQKSLVDEEVPGVGEIEIKVEDKVIEKPQRRFTRSALKPTVEEKESDGQHLERQKSTPNSVLVDEEVPGVVENDIKVIEKPLRRFTRSALKPMVEEKESDGQQLNLEKQKSTSNSVLVNEEVPGVAEDEIKVIEKPQRRFTRSALKPTVEEKESNGQQLNLERQKSTSSSLSNLARMSRLSSLKELLDTGILEGQNVRFLGGSKARGANGRGFRGVITGSSILCHCAHCKGTEIVTPNVFAVHAGSSNKRASEYLYLENGKTFSDVMVVCQNSPLETLEEDVELVVGCSSINKSTICLNCKESMGGEGARSAMLLCSSCIELKVSRAGPALADNHSDKSPKPVTDPKHFDAMPKYISPNPITLPNKPESVSKYSLAKPATAPERTNIVPECSSPKPVTGPKRPHSVPRTSTSDYKSQGRITRKDLRLHKLVFEEDVLPDGAEVAYYSKGEKMLVGYKKGSAIVCSCCDNEVSASTFEAHAGFQTRRKPYDSIYTSNGVSLHELALKLSTTRKPSTENRDDLCSICRDAGDLFFCDNCPRAFHKDCLSLPTVPRGTWYCKNCQNMIEKEKHVESNLNAVAAGRVAGVDPIEQITNRCIRIVTNFEEKLGGCALCRSHEFSGSDFGPGTVILCDQCEKEYHVGCLKDNGFEELKELPKGKWFCCSNCLRVYSVLQKLVVHGEQKLPDSILDVVRKKHNENGLESGVSLDVKWRVLNGKTSTDVESLEFLSKALTIFHDRFAPIVDPTTGLDFINEMLYGKTIQNQEFGGMYCAIVTVNQLVVSAGMFRIYGAEVAELPLVATSADYQGQGYFRILFSCIERLLAFLNVKSLLLPAADEAESIWRNRFGFEKLTPNEIHNYRKMCQMMIFHGTSMLRKSVPKCRVLS